MKVVIFGGRVESVLVVSRQSVDVRHPKLREIIRKDFFDFSDVQSQFADLDACFFWRGVSSVGSVGCHRRSHGPHARAQADRLHGLINRG
jgi:hypothetical protein